MRKNLTKKLFLSVLTLAFAVISLGASTYAWFVLSEDANVETFTGTVQSGTSGLEIGVNLVSENAPVQWRATSLNIKNDLPTLFDFNGDKKEDFRFDAVQNADPFTKNFTDISGVDNSANGKYLAFKLFFRLADKNDETPNKSVYLTNYSMDTTGGVENWFVNKDYFAVNHKCAEGADHKDCAKEFKAGASAVYYVSDAARIAIDGVNDLYLETNEFKATDAKYYSEGKQQYGALSYYNAIKSEEQLPFPGTEYANPTYGVTKQYEGKTAVCELNKDNQFTASITVYIWVDGWDGECINAIFGQTLAIDFKFSLNQRAEAVEGE